MNRYGGFHLSSGRRPLREQPLSSGHGDHLAYGIIKSLFVKVMMWLLDRRDPQMRGIRYLHYGAIQHGNAGLAHWKDRFQFAPFAFRLERTRAGPRRCRSSC
jgi:hypothetical protein